MTIIKKHAFVPKAFRRLRLTLLFLAYTPSFVLDGFILYGFAVGHSVLGPFIETADLQATLMALAANFILTKSILLVFYLRLHGQRARSFVFETENGVIYRKSKLMSIVKTDWKNAYAFNDDIELFNVTSFRRNVFGSIVVKGTFKIIRKLPDTGAYFGERKARRVVIPAYFEDIDGIAEKLSYIRGIHQ